MRIYTTSNALKKNTSSISNIDKMEPYFCENRLVQHLITKDGTLLLENNKLYRMHKDPRPAKNTLLGVYPVTISYDLIKGEECFQIPPQSTIEKLTYKVYKVSPESVGEWIFVYDNSNSMKEQYFSVPDGIDIHRADVIRGLNPLRPLRGLPPPTTPT
jgi:hypothetical protein